MTATLPEAPAQTDAQMVYAPLPEQSRWQGLALLGWLLLMDGLLLMWLARKPVDWMSFVLALLLLATIPLLIHVAIRTWGAFNLEYWLDRNALRVRWAGMCQVIPLNRIQRIVQGAHEFAAQPLLSEWPSPFVRSQRGSGGQRLVRLASAPLDACLLIETDEGIFAISPSQPDAFLAELQSLNRLGPARTLPLERQRPTNLYALATESATGRWLLLAGLFGCLALFGYVMIRFPHLPDTLVFHYNSQGLPDSIRPKSVLFLLPIIGLLAFLANSAGGLWMKLRSHPSGANLFWAGTLLVQILTFLALISLSLP